MLRTNDNILSTHERLVSKVYVRQGYRRDSPPNPYSTWYAEIDVAAFGVDMHVTAALTVAEIEAARAMLFDGFGPKQFLMSPLKVCTSISASGSAVKCPRSL